MVKLIKYPKFVPKIQVNFPLAFYLHVHFKELAKIKILSRCRGEEGEMKEGAGVGGPLFLTEWLWTYSLGRLCPSTRTTLGVWWLSSSGG